MPKHVQDMSSPIRKGAKNVICKPERCRTEMELWVEREGLTSL